MIKKKICLLGPFAVGKTSLVKRFVYDRFDEKYLTTIGVKISQKLLSPVEDPKSGQHIQYTFIVWDIAGMDKFDGVVENYYRGSAGALAVADLIRPETIGQLHDICDRYLSVNPGSQLLVLGNKLDVFEQEDETISLLENTASAFSTDFLLTSAKTGEKVEEAFLKLAKKMAETHERDDQTNTDPQKPRDDSL